MPRKKKVADAEPQLVAPEPTGGIGDAVAPDVAQPKDPIRRGRQKKEKEAVDPTDVHAFLKNRFPGKIFAGDEYTMPWALRRLPTKIASLDIAINGGFPAGTLSMLIGEPSCGKNMLSACVLAEQQNIWGADLKVAVITTEAAWAKDQARMLGCRVGMSPAELASFQRAHERAGRPLSSAAISELQTTVGSFTFTAHGLPTDELFEIGLDMVRSRYFHVILIDSFGAILTSEDFDKNLSENDRVAGPAILNTKFATRVMQALGPDKEGNPNMTLVLGINQVRDNLKMANPNSPTKKEAGGWGLKHARQLAIEMQRVSWQNLEKGSKVRTGKEIGWNIVKQKAGGYDGAAGQFLYRMGSGPHYALDLIETGVKYGVIKREGNTYTDEGTLIGPEKSCGLTRAADWLEEDPDQMQSLYDRCMSAADIFCEYR